MVEVVLDTNVLVAAFRSSLGASYRLLQTLQERLWRPVISPTLAFEYEAVLKRGAPHMGLTLQDIDDFVEYLLVERALFNKVGLRCEWSGVPIKVLYDYHKKNFLATSCCGPYSNLRVIENLQRDMAMCCCCTSAPACGGEA
jgi:PIN domain-containing protein